MVMNEGWFIIAIPTLWFTFEEISENAAASFQKHLGAAIFIGSWRA